MPERSIQVPLLYNGISQQPAHLRYPSQLEDGENVVCSLVDGTSTRAGSILVTAIEDLPDDGDLRIHPITRDKQESYVVLYGEGGLRIIQIQPGTTQSGECSLTIQPDAQLYLDKENAGASDLRLVSIQDYTIIANTAAATGATTAADFAVDKITRDYDTVLSIVPPAGTTAEFHVRAEQDTTGEPAGHWQFDPDLALTGLWGTTAYTAASDADWLKPNGHWTDTSKNPSGFTVALGRRFLSSSSGVWAPGTLRLTITNAFTDYTPAADDQIKVTGGTGVTAGWYDIVAKIDNSTIELGSSIAAGTPSNVAVDGIGHNYVDVQIDLTGVVLETLHDVALEMQTALRTAGAVDACVAWDAVSKGFVLAAPWRGSGSRTYTMAAPTSPIYDLTAGTRPFGGGATYLLGTGGYPANPLVPPSDRWFKTAKPNDEEGKPDPLKMPVQLVRTSAGGIEPGPWTLAVSASVPWVFYNFNELGGRANVTVDNVTGLASRDGLVTVGGAGSYIIATGTIAETGNEALYMASGTTAANYATVTVGGVDGGGLPIPHSLTLNEGFSFEVVAYRQSTAATCQLCCISDAAGNLKINIEVDATGAFSFTVRDQDLNGVSWTKNAAGNIFPTGSWKHIVCTYDPAGATEDDKMKVYINGALQTVTAFFISVAAPTGFASDLLMQVSSTFYSIPGITGWYDAFAFYTRPLNQTEITAHYTALSQAGGSSTSFSEFEVDVIDWSERTSGSKITNPLPSLILEGRPIADIGLHRNRFVIAGDGNIVFSAAGDLFQFFLEDFDNLVDSDPIDLPIGSNEVCIIQHIMPWRTTLLAFTEGGRQFQLNAPEALTPSTASATPTTNEQTQPTRPVLIGSTIQFIVDNGDHATLAEYVVDEETATNTPVYLTEHVETLLPKTIRTVTAHGGLGFTIVLPQTDDGDELYVHRTWFVNGERKQSAWTKWSFDGVRIVDIAVIKDDLWMLCETLDGWTLEYLQLGKIETPAGFPYAPIVDRQVQTVGVHAAGETTWTFTTPDSDRNVIVLGSDFGANSGRTLTPIEVTDYTVVCEGDWDAGPAISGRLISGTFELTRPFVRDFNGVAKTYDKTTIVELRTTHANTGAYTIQSAMPLRAARSKAFNKAAYGIEERGTLRAWLNGDASTNTISIASVDARPFSIVGVEYLVDHEPRSA